MLEEAADDTDHANAITDVRNSGSQAADAPHDKIDFNPRLRRAIERVYHVSVYKRVHFTDDPGRPPCTRMIGFSRNELDEARAHVHGRNDQLAVQLLPRISGQRVEQIADVSADGWAGRQ